MDLIDKANDINKLAQEYDPQGPVHKELKKIEMYIRKTFIMLRHTHKLAEADHSEETFLKDLNAALIRDQKYVKARDSLGDYEI